MERCIHDMVEGTCSICKKPPIGINTIVYVSKGGAVFHNDPMCVGLLAGQNYADSMGMKNHPINPVPWGVAATSKGPCEVCCNRNKA